MKKLLQALVIGLVFLSAAARASVESDALGALNAADAQVAASSAIHSPSLNNIDKVRGELGILPPFLQRLVASLNGLSIGPSAQVTELALGLSVKIDDAGKTSTVDVAAIIKSCQGISADMRALQALVPQLRTALAARLDTQTAALVQQEVKAAFPTPIPDLASAPVSQPTPTRVPVAAPAPASSGPVGGFGVPAAALPTPVPSLDGGLLPGGIVLPPPPAPSTPVRPGQPTTQPTPRAQLKAPIAIASLANGQEVYVGNFNAGSVSVLSTSSKRVTDTIPVGTQPVALALNSSGHLLLVVNKGSNNVTLINTVKREVLATLGTGSQPVDAVISPDGKKAYVVNSMSNSVTVLDLDKLRAIRNISVGHQPSRLAMPASGQAVYVSNTQDDSISIIDTRLDDVVATVDE